MKRPSSPRRGLINPYMRGIGCLLMVVVPVFSFALGDYMAGQGFGYQVLPASWYVAMTFPPQVYQLSGLSIVASYLSSIPHLPATLTFMVLGIVVIGGIMSIIFGYMYSLFAPSKYGPTDVPPPRVKTKKYKR